MPDATRRALQTLTLRLQVNGSQTARELAVAAKIDRSQVSRLVAGSGGLIQQIGAARRSRYALRRNIRSTANRWPVYRIDEAGRAGELGELEAFYGGWRLRWNEPPAWSRLVTDQDDWAEGMPFFIEDMRPQGFIGRLIAGSLPEAMALPRDPTSWSDDDVLHFLINEGHDVPGNILIGDRALRKLLTPPFAGPDVVDPLTQYPKLAEQVLEGGVFGSSAAGEQQKFATRVEHGGGVNAVLVKFSPRMDTPAGQRWADLLVAEEIASSLLASVGEGQSGVRVVDSGGRRFLEIPRFDRANARGRRGAVSLTALQSSRVPAAATDWIESAEHLQTESILSESTVTSVRWRSFFGQLIANSDMHSGNLTFYLDETLPLGLAPSYDMLPMLWAPRGPEIVERSFTPLAPLPRQMSDWNIAAGWAFTFWQQLAADPRISKGFADIAKSSADTVGQLRHEFGTDKQGY